MLDIKICFVKGRVASQSHKHPPVRIYLPRLKRAAARAFTTRNFKHAIVVLLVNNDSRCIPGLDLGRLRLSESRGQKNVCFIRRAPIMKRWGGKKSMAERPRDWADAIGEQIATGARN